MKKAKNVARLRQPNKVLPKTIFIDGLLLYPTDSELYCQTKLAFD